MRDPNWMARLGSCDDDVKPSTLAAWRSNCFSPIPRGSPGSVCKFNACVDQYFTERKANGIKCELERQILLFLGHRSLIKNKTQTAVINILNLHIFDKTRRFLCTLHTFSKVTVEI